ncbi:SH3 domain [Trinorchestia longiramus]|nr:SH3 domain [Trinorchestia longiramus]
MDEVSVMNGSDSVDKFGCINVLGWNVGKLDDIFEKFEKGRLDSCIMPTLRLQICLLLLQFTSHVHGKLSNLQRCADPQCQEAIAVARTTVKYQPDYEGGLFFPNNAVATIYSKDAGSNPDLWGVEINGKRGYAPKRFLREDRVMVPYESLKHIVPVDSSSLLSKNDKNKITIDQKIDEVRTIDNLTADENEETDGGEEFHDDGGDEEDLDGIQTYAESNSLSNTKQEQPALEAKQEQPALAAQPFVAEAKPEEHRTATEGTFSSSARDASADISASSVDFEIVDGTTIMVDPVDTTLPTPAYLPDYETPPPVHANIPNTVHATTPTPLLSPSAQTVMPLTGAGVDGSSTPELQMVPSDLSLSSSEFRNTPATATPAPAASSPVVNSIDKSTSDTEHSGTVVPSDISNPETASVDSDSTGTTSKGEVAGDEAKPDKNDFNLLNGSDIKLNVAASTNEQNDAGVDAASVGVESNSLPSRDNYPSVQQDSVPISPMPKSEPSDVEFNIDHPIDGHNSVSKDDVVRGEAVDGATSEGAKSDHTISDVEGKTSESGDHIPDDETEDGGSLFDVWLSGWSSTEDGGDTTGGAYQEAPEQSSVMSEPGEQSNLDYSGDGVVDGMPNSVGEVNFNTAADQVTERESSSSFDTTTEQVPTTTTGAAAVAGISNSNEGSAVVQQSTGYSGDGGAMSGSETASDSVAAVDAQLLDDGGALGDVSTSSPIPELRDPGLEPGKEDLDFHNSVIENSVSGLSNLVTDVPESFADVSNLLIDDLEPVTESSEPLIKASELFNEASPLNDDSTLGLSEFDPMPDNSKSADQLPSEEMVSNELPADTANAMIDSSGDISGEALVVGDGAVPPVKSDAPDTLALDPAGDSSDLHDPESLTGHLLKTVEPIVQLMTGSSQLGESLSLALEHDLSSPLAASGAFAAVVIVALTILLLYLASALVTKCSREGPLLKALNVLEHEQHISEQLIADLQSKLSTSHGQLQTVTEAGIADGSEVARVMAQLQQVQEENVTLVERMQDLEQQLEESTNSGLEMDNMLQELLHSQKDTASFQEAIDSLQLMLDSQREKVESLTADLSMKTTLNEELRGESVTAKERIRKLEYQLDQVTVVSLSHFAC